MNLIITAGFPPFLMLTYRFSVILGAPFIYYGISDAIITLVIRLFCYLFVNYRLYSMAHSNLKLLMTLHTHKKKEVG